MGGPRGGGGVSFAQPSRNYEEEARIREAQDRRDNDDRVFRDQQEARINQQQQMQLQMQQRDEARQIAAIEQANRRDAEAGAARQEESQRFAARDAAEKVRYENDLTLGVNTGRTQTQQAFAARGVNANDFNDQIESALTQAKLTVPRGAAVGSFFGDDFVNGVLNTAQTTRRTANNTALQRIFPTDNFANSRFSDTADDAFINDVLGVQRGEAVLSLDRAKARGNLNDVGYAGALSRVNDLEKSGRSTANTLGNAVVQGYRTRANDVAGRARSAASSYTLGGPKFDADSYGTELSGLDTSFSSNIEGDTRAALSGQNFFDIGDILTRAATSQGAVNVAMPGAGVIANKRGVIPGLLDRDQAGGGVF